MAKALSAAGFATYVLDIRGHGGSGRKGQIAYIGQLEDDLTDFMHAVSPSAPATLAGFSSGGGFAVRDFAETANAVFRQAMGNKQPRARPPAQRQSRSGRSR